MKNRNETYEEMKENLIAEWKEAENANRNGICKTAFMFIMRVILFPICLLVRLFRWTYRYED